jgi:hypothetical protein
MRKLMGLLTLLSLFTLSAHAQVGSRTFTTTVVADDVGLGNIGSGIAFHQLSWNPVASVPTCQVKLQQSVDNVTFVDLIANQTCTSSGQSTVVNAVVNYIKISVTTKSGAGSIVVHWSGYNTAPGGTFSGSISTGQVAYGSAANTIAGAANVTYDSTNKAINIANPSTPCALAPISLFTTCGPGIGTSALGAVPIIGPINITTSNAEFGQIWTDSRWTGNTGATLKTFVGQFNTSVNAWFLDGFLNNSLAAAMFIDLANFKIGFSVNGAIGGGLTLDGNAGTVTSDQQIVDTLPTGTAPLAVSSTTPVATMVVAAHPLEQACGTTSSCSHTAKTNGKIVYGSAPLVTGTPSTVTISGISPAFSDTTYICTVTNATSAIANLLSVTVVSSSSFTITGPAANTNVINYICVGN